MENKYGTAIFVIFLIVLVILLNNPNINDEEVQFKVHYYRDGIEVYPNQGTGLFSLVSPPGEVFDQISLDVVGSAQDNSFKNIRIVDAQPQQFWNALFGVDPSDPDIKDLQDIVLKTGDTLDKTGYPVSMYRALSYGETKVLYSSEPMDTTLFESMNQPVEFSIKLSAEEGYSGNVVYSSGSVDLTIEECMSHADYMCYDGDVYWYDTCNIREDKKQECGISGYTGLDYCYNNNLYRDYATRGCSIDSCTSSIQRYLQQYCTYGCSLGACNSPEEVDYSFSLSNIDFPSFIYYDEPYTLYLGSFTNTSDINIHEINGIIQGGSRPSPSRIFLRLKVVAENGGVYRSSNQIEVSPNSCDVYLDEFSVHLPALLNGDAYIEIWTTSTNYRYLQDGGCGNQQINWNVLRAPNPNPQTKDEVLLN